MAFAARASLSDNAKALSYCSCSSSWRESSRLLPSHSTHSPASVFIRIVYRVFSIILPQGVSPLRANDKQEKISRARGHRKSTLARQPAVQLGSESRGSFSMKSL